jgi:hypothetical protein
VRFGWGHGPSLAGRRPSILPSTPAAARPGSDRKTPRGLAGPIMNAHGIINPTPTPKTNCACRVRRAPRAGPAAHHTAAAAVPGCPPASPPNKSPHRRPGRPRSNQRASGATPGRPAAELRSLAESTLGRPPAGRHRPWIEPGRDRPRPAGLLVRSRKLTASSCFFCL